MLMVMVMKDVFASDDVDKKAMVVEGEWICSYDWYLSNSLL